MLFVRGGCARRGLIREAVTERPDALVVTGFTAARKAREATVTIPVVVASSSDLIGAGIVASRELIQRASALRVPVVHYWPGTAEQRALISHDGDALTCEIGCERRQPLLASIAW